MGGVVLMLKTQIGLGVLGIPLVFVSGDPSFKVLTLKRVPPD